MKNKKNAPWRIIIGIVSIIFIVFMWIQKDIVSIYSSFPKEQLVPLVVTSVAVMIIKTAALAAVLLLIKWLVGKFRNKNENNK